MGSVDRRRRYRPVLGVVRIAGVTFIATLLAFAISLFFGIVGIVLVKMIRGTSTPDLSLAYRHVALPIAALALAMTFLVALVSEIRHYKQERMRQRTSTPRTWAA